MTTSEPDTNPRKRRPVEGDERASCAVVEAVARATGEDVDSLPPLHGRVDADALDRLFGAQDGTDDVGLIFTRVDDIPADVEVRFEYADFDVTVTENYVVLE